MQSQVITGSSNPYGTAGVPPGAGPPVVPSIAVPHQQAPKPLLSLNPEPNNNQLGHGKWGSEPLVDSGTPGGSSTSSVCNCASFLDPFPNQITWRSVSNLQHYCRVCNTQLNSCKQSRIHAEGKKHEKRLAYLKFCFENNTGSSNVPSSPPASFGGVATAAAPPTDSSTNQQQPTVAPSSAATQQTVENQLELQSNEMSEVKSPTMLTAATMPPGVPAGLPAGMPPAIPTSAPPFLSQMYPSYLHYTAPPAAFYFPAQSYPSSFPEFVALPTGPTPTTPMGMPMSIPQCGPAGYYNGPTAPGAAPTAVPPNNSSKQYQQQFQKTNEGRLNNQSKKVNVNKGLKKEKTFANNAPKTTASSSGFGGSVSSRTSNSSHILSCDLCSLTFPSLSVLNNHVKGQRHIRKVKSQVAYKQMKAAGTNFKEECGEIQCEVCRVSVNSSHQLQAHLAGHKHKVRCYKRGLDPCAALVTPTSTTPPSTAPSECSAPHSSVSSKYHQYTAATSSPSYSPSVQTTPHASPTKSLLGLPQLPPKLPPKPAGLGSALISANNNQPGLLGEYPAQAAAAVNALRGLLPQGVISQLPLSLPKPSVATTPGVNPGGGLHKSVRSANLSQTRDKTKTRKQPRKAIERRDSTTESDEATDATCVKKEPIHKEDAAIVNAVVVNPCCAEKNNPGSKDADLKNSNNVDHESSESTTPSTSSSCDQKSSKGNDFSSDEAKESEGDSDPVQDKSKSKIDTIDTSASTIATSDSAVNSPPQSRIIETKPVKHSCDICNITVNSATQLAQHMNSPKHHVKAAEEKQKKSNEDKKLKEIPMLNMFLKTLQPPPQYFPNQEEKETEENSSNTEVER